MKIYNFRPSHGEKIENFNSDFIFSKIARSTAEVKVSCFHLAENGVVGYHEAVTMKLFLVLKGMGWARGNFPNRIPIVEFQAVFWDVNEWHEVGTDLGLIAIVIEGDFLNPFDFMNLDWEDISRHTDRP